MEDAKARRAEEIFDIFMCYCSNADEILGVQLRLFEKKIPKLESAIKEDLVLKKQFESDLKKHEADRS